MIIQGNAATVLFGESLIRSNSVQTVVTSPPYFQLRKYSDNEDEIGNVPLEPIPINGPSERLNNVRIIY